MLLAKLKNHKPLGIIAIIIAVVCLGAAVFGGYKLFKNHRDSQARKVSNSFKQENSPNAPASVQEQALNKGQIQSTDGGGNLAVAEDYLREKNYDKAAEVVKPLANDPTKKRPYTCEIMIKVYVGKGQTSEKNAAASYCAGQCLQDVYPGNDGKVYQYYCAAKVYKFVGDTANAKKYFKMLVDYVDANPDLKNNESIPEIYGNAKANS